MMYGSGNVTRFCGWEQSCFNERLRSMAFFHGLLLPGFVLPPPSILLATLPPGEIAGLLLRYARVSLSTSYSSAGDRTAYSTAH